MIIFYFIHKNYKKSVFSRFFLNNFDNNLCDANLLSVLAQRHFKDFFIDIIVCLMYYDNTRA